MSVLTVIAYVLIFAGVVVFAGAGVGMVRFRDPYQRASAVGTAAGLGISLITIGAVLTMPTAENLIKAAVAVVLQLATSAVGSTIIARAAVNSGHVFSHDTDLTDLDEAGTAAMATLRAQSRAESADPPAADPPAADPPAADGPPVERSSSDKGP